MAIKPKPLPYAGRTFAAFMERQMDSSLAMRYSRWELWREFIAWMLAGLQDDAATAAAIEARKPDAVEHWKLWAEALRAAFKDEPLNDHLGQAYMTIGTANKAFSQFFTPFHVAELMAAMNLSQPIELEPGRLAMGLEPCCGSGCMVLAAEKVRLQEGLPPIIWTLIDLDPVCTGMAAIACCLADIPALVLCGDSLLWGINEDHEKIRLVSPRVRVEIGGVETPLTEVNEGQAALIRRNQEAHALEAMRVLAAASEGVA